MAQQRPCAFSSATKPSTNPHNAQLLFTTHDTHLLGTTLSATCVFPLTDYKPRQAENLERGYLQGRYGAIPFLGDLARIAETNP